MKTNNIKVINAHQQQIYERFDTETTMQLISNYADIYFRKTTGIHYLKTHAS
jgi:hypothetical protein